MEDSVVFAMNQKTSEKAGFSLEFGGKEDIMHLTSVRFVIDAKIVLIPK